MSDIYQIIKRLDAIAEAKDSIELDPKTGEVKSWEHEGDWQKKTKKDPVGKIHNMSDRAVKKTQELDKQKPVKENDSVLGLADQTRKSMVVKQANLIKQEVGYPNYRAFDAHDVRYISDKTKISVPEVCKYLNIQIPAGSSDQVREGDLNQGAGPKFVGYLKGQDPASKRYSKYVGDSKTQNAIRQGISLVGESNMSEKDIELQDYKSMTAQEFERAYKMSKQEWINKNKALVINNPSIRKSLKLDEDQVEARWTIKTEDDDGIQLQTHRRKYPSVKAAREAYKKMKPYASDFKYKATKKKKVDESVYSPEIAKAVDWEEKIDRLHKRIEKETDPEILKALKKELATTKRHAPELVKEASVSEDMVGIAKSFADFLRSVEDEKKDRDLQDRKPEVRDVQAKVAPIEMLKPVVVRAKLGPKGEHKAEVMGDIDNGFTVHINDQAVGLPLKNIDLARRAIEDLHQNMLTTHKDGVRLSLEGSPDDYVEE